MRLAIANQKGGTGKTTNAVGLAAAAGADGARVLLIDTDLGQDRGGTAQPWHAYLFAGAVRQVAPHLADDETVSPLDLYGADREKAKIASLAIRRVGFECLTIDEMGALGFKEIDTWRHVVIDCPPGQPAQIAEAFKIVDVALISAGANFSELSGIGGIKNIIEAVGRPIALRVLLNRIDSRQTAPKEAQDILDREGVEACRTRIPRRANIEHLWPSRHPATSLQGWVAWRDLWDELNTGDPEPDDEGDE